VFLETIEMATYNSTAVANNAPTSTHGAAGNVKVARAVRYLRGRSGDLDTINFFDLPANARIHYALLQASDMDTNGTPLLALNVGYSGSASRCSRPRPWARRALLPPRLRSRRRICC
jgi:hypothetical protein